MSDQDRKLFVGGLNITTDTAILKDYFSNYGEVADAIVMTNPQTKKSKCFGFVSFVTSDVIDVVQSKRPHTIDGKTVDTKRAIPKDDPSPESRVSCKKLFVGGLKKSVTQEQLQDYFSQYGNVVECQLVMDKVTNSSRGFGFITYEDTDTVDKVILAKPHQINDSRADVKKALSKDEMNSVKAKTTAHNGNSQAGMYRNGQQNSYMSGQQQAGWNGYAMPQQQGWGSQQQQPYGQYPAYSDPNAAYSTQGQQQNWGTQPGWGAPYMNQSAPVGGFGDGYQNNAASGSVKNQMSGNRAGPY